jgi:crotonobetainyl-CoA:carnitine CoA-transferase CaiB-like acyl-CoA transferase
VSRRDRDELLARLIACGAPATPVLAPEETTAHAQIRGRGFHVRSDAGLVAGLPARLASGGRMEATHVPDVGEHPDGFTPR